MKSWLLSAAAAVAAVVVIGVSDAGLWVWRGLVAVGLAADADCPGGLSDGGLVEPMCAAPRGVSLVAGATLVAAALAAAYVTRRVTRQRATQPQPT